MNGHFCLVPRVSVHDRYYCILDVRCGANRLGDSGVHTLGDNSAFVDPAGQLLPGGVRPE